MQGGTRIRVRTHAWLYNTIVVEDGTGKATATSYMSVTTVNGLIWHSPAAEAWNKLTWRKKVQAVQQVTQYLDAKYRYYGLVMTTAQALQWPRTKNYDRFGDIIAPGTIPEQLLQAFILLCGFWTDEDTLLTQTDPAGQVKQIAAEGMTVSYDTKSGDENLLVGQRFPEVELLLKSIGEINDSNWMATKKTLKRPTTFQ